MKTSLLPHSQYQKNIQHKHHNKTQYGKRTSDHKRRFPHIGQNLTRLFVWFEIIRGVVLTVEFLPRLYCSKHEVNIACDI